MAEANSNSFVKVAKRVAVGMLIASLLIPLKVYLEHTGPGERVNGWTFELLQSQLPFSKYDESLPVVLVDITKIPGGKDQTTPRESLRPIIESLAAQRPAAIAIDIDFSPNENGWLSDEDPEFFDFCLQIRTERNVPVFLGVHRTRGEAADTWLGLEKYSELAAAGVAQDDGVIMYMPRWIRGLGTVDKLPAISTALATSYKRELPGPPKWLAPFIETDSNGQHGRERTIKDMKFAETLVNFSKLQEIASAKQSTISAQSISEAGHLFAGKMVLIGDATEFTDSFVVAGFDRAIAGAYLEASAAYTLAQAPLFEFKFVARLILDLVLSFLLILGIQWVRIRYVNIRIGPRFKKAQARFVLVATGIVFIGGLVLVRKYNVMWLDFLFVISLLFLHPGIEARIEGIWKQIFARKALSRVEA